MGAFPKKGFTYWDFESRAVATRAVAEDPKGGGDTDRSNSRPAPRFLLSNGPMGGQNTCCRARQVCLGHTVEIGAI
eukprot:6979272-Prymnesium_polylepis.1